jgi:uncharacterized protein YecT (DUF1311 family)
MRRKMISMVLLACAGFLGNAASTRAQCDNPKTNEERAQRIGGELRGSDATINHVYGDLMKSLSPTEKTALRDQQRAWIKARDKKCALTWSKGDREVWLADLLKDYQKTVCVVRLTNERVDTLNNYEKTNHVEPPAEDAGNNRGSTAGDDDAVYVLTSSNSRKNGKWYFEVRVDPGAVLKAGEASFFIGVQQNGVEAGAINAEGISVGELMPVRRKYRDADPAILGFALDTDNGKLYISRNGVWESGDPGTAGGQDLIRGRAYEAVVNSSIELNSLESSRAIEVNFGEKSFNYHLPNGYLPLKAN